MKITMYELLGLVKDSKAPKKIKYDNIIFEYDGIYYMAEHTYLDEYCDLSRVLNDEVEILEEEKKIPEKLPDIRFENGKFYLPINDKQMYILREIDKVFLDKFNEIIDYLKSKGE